ncbi:MAG: RIO1 family regulatory kinase/ATPase [Nitratireductor sp.]
MNKKTIMFNAEQIEYKKEIFNGMASHVYKTHDNNIIKTPRSSPEKYKSYYTRELYWLKKLSKTNIVPKVINYDESACAIQMEYKGEPLTKDNLPKDWKKQLKNILAVLKKHNCSHNDLSEKELLVLDNKISIIDFGVASLSDDMTCGGICENTRKLRVFSDAYIINSVELLTSIAFANAEPHCFVLWDTEEEKQVEATISKSFTIVQKIRYHTNSTKLLGPHRLDFLYKFYHGRVSKHGNKAKDPFTVFVVFDQKPKYEVRKNVFNGDENVLNVNTFDFLQKIRKGRTSFLHGSDCIQESFDNLEALCMYDTNIPLKYWYEWRPKFNSIDEFFERLNQEKSLKYVVLRNFEDLLLNTTPANGGDIDLLVNDFYLFKRLTGAIGTKHKASLSYRNGADAVEYGGYKVAAKVSIEGTEVPIDIRYVGDNYYEKQWEVDILKTRQSVKSFYIPNKEHFFYTLLYHALVHKKKLSKKYRNLLSEKAKEIKGISQINASTTDETYWAILDSFLKNKNYNYVRPDELSIPFNARSRTDLSINDDIKDVKKKISNRQLREARHLLDQLLAEKPYNMEILRLALKVKLKILLNKKLGKDSKLSKMILKDKLQNK